MVSDQVEAFIDRELGICLRQVSSYQGHLIMRTELTGLTTACIERQFVGYGLSPSLGSSAGAFLRRIA